MQTTAFLGTVLPLFSAITVALVGVFTRRAQDRLAYLSLVNATGVAVCAPMLPFVPLPTPAAFTLLAATAVVHWFYQLSMMRTLALGDLSLAFPLMRGLAPVLIALFSAIALGEHLSAQSWMGLAIATMALTGFGMAGRRASAGTIDPRVFAWAILTACLIAAYSTIDAAGVRAMEQGEGWAYIIWFFVVGGLPIPLTGAWRRRHALAGAIASSWRPGLAAGCISLLSYASAMYAMGIIPVAHVAAIRETSAVFAALLGWLLLGESFGAWRVVLAAVAVAGLAILKLG